MQDDPMSHDDAVARFIHETTWESLPDKVQSQAIRCLLDTLGAAIAGRATELSDIVHDFAADVFGGQQADLWQDGRRVSPPGAALANGMTIDSFDIHDGHSLTKGHAGAAVIPAAFAAIGMRSDPLDGRELLTLIAVGYEIALRAGISLHATAADYHTSGAWNALGCAALVARRLRLSPNQTLHALGIAEYHGPRSPMMRCIDHPTMLKDGSGWGAMTGVSAALLASRGFTGAPAETIAGTNTADDSPWDKLGERWELLNLYFKPHAICRWAQPAVEGALRLKTEYQIDPVEITAIHIETFHEAVRLAVRQPATTEEAQYSLPFAVAAMLVHGELAAKQLCGDGLRDKRVLRLAQMIELDEAPELSEQFPARRFAHISIETDGKQRHETQFAEPNWDAGNPPSDDELIAKFQSVCRSWSNDRVAELETAVLECPRTADVTRLVELMRKPDC